MTAGTRIGNLELLAHRRRYEFKRVTAHVLAIVCSIFGMWQATQSLPVLPFA
jgi:hypothetical protein